MTRAEEVLICHQYADRLIKSLQASKQRMRVAGSSDIRVMYSFLAIPLELAKRHDARYVACVMFFLMEAHQTKIPTEAVQNIISVLKSVRVFDNHSLELMLRIKEIQQVTRSIVELRNLLQKIADALMNPDMELISDAMDWHDARKN